jgi:O-antigen/teichoic acid export membrane protein
LIPAFKIWGAVASTLLGFSAMLLVGLWQAQRMRRFAYEYRRMLLAMLTALVVGAVFALVRPPSPLLQVGLAVLCAVVYPGLLILMRFAEPDEKAFVDVFISGALRRAALRLRWGS